RERLDLRRVGLERVELEASAARLGDDPLQDVRLAAGPELERHAVAALEVGGKPELVVLRERGVEHQLAFLLRAGDEARGAIGAFQRRDSAYLWRGLGTERGCACEEQAKGEAGELR